MHLISKCQQSKEEVFTLKSKENWKPNKTCLKKCQKYNKNWKSSWFWKTFGETYWTSYLFYQNVKNVIKIKIPADLEKLLEEPIKYLTYFNIAYNEMLMDNLYF